MTALRPLAALLLTLAVLSPVGAEALLAETERALQQMAPAVGPAPNLNP